MNYLFSWDNIPGNDNGRLIDFLKQNYSIDWVETAEIVKIDDGKTLILSTEKNFLYLKLTDEKTNVRLKIDDGRTGEFTVKMENGKLNIYKMKIHSSIEYGDDVSIHYTPEAKERIESFNRSMIKQIERLIKERKYVPGDEIIEITGSDILFATKYIKIIKPKQKELRYFVIYLYFITGIVTLFVGLFYQQLMELFFNSRTQAMLIIIGLAMTLLSFLLLRFTELKERRYKNIKQDENND